MEINNRHVGWAILTMFLVYCGHHMFSCEIANRFNECVGCITSSCLYGVGILFFVIFALIEPDWFKFTIPLPFKKRRARRGLLEELNDKMLKAESDEELDLLIKKKDLLEL